MSNHIREKLAESMAACDSCPWEILDRDDRSVYLKYAVVALDVLSALGYVKAEGEEWGVRSTVNGDDVVMSREVAERMSRLHEMPLVRRQVSAWEVA